MKSLLSNNSIFSYLGTTKGVVTIAIVTIIICAFILITKITKLNLFSLIHKIIIKVTNALGNITHNFIGKSESKYRRDLEIGKIDEKCKRVKTYRFLNDLIIDLGLKQIGASPYEFLFICLISSLIGTFIVCEILFGNAWMTLLLFPITSAGVICVLYTKANVAHDTRIESVIEAENIVCNNIKDGVVVAVKNSINVIPSQVRGEFKDFIDNVEHKNYHVRTALMELNQHLGSTADDFIKKCIVFETEEEHGIVGMFKDVVELNNIKMESRTDMKRRFEEVKTEFIIGATMIFVFLGGVLAIYPNVAHFYFKTTIGQLIIAMDALLVISEFVYITYLRAKEL